MSKYSDKLKRRAEEAARKRTASTKVREPSHEVVPRGSLPKSVSLALIAAGRFVNAVENCKDDFKSYASSQKGLAKTVALGARLALISAKNTASSVIVKSAPFISKTYDDMTNKGDNK